MFVALVFMKRHDCALMLAVAAPDEQVWLPEPIVHTSVVAIPTPVHPATVA